MYGSTHYAGAEIAGRTRDSMNRQMLHQHASSTRTCTGEQVCLGQTDHRTERIELKYDELSHPMHACHQNDTDGRLADWISNSHGEKG